MLNQFSLSEHDGVLRVATTDQPPWRAARSSAQSESYVTVLDERDGSCSEVGRVGGLGRGERIFAVRFLGEKGYVVTFRQVDPLYTLDLSNPEKPDGPGRAEDPRVLVVPAPDRRTTCCSGSARTRTSRGRRAGRSCRCSTCPT